MSEESTRYPRRDFLCQCAAMPLAAGVANALEANAAEGPAFPFKRFEKPEAELAREVEELLKLVDPQVRYRHVPLDADKNAWPLWAQAGQAYVAAKGEEFWEGVERLSQESQEVSDGVRQRIVDWVDQNEACRQLIDQGIARGAVEYPRATKSVRLSLAMDELSGVRNLARLKATTCYVRSSQGDTRGAAREAASILTMGTMLMRAECLFVDYLAALGILSIGREAAYQAAMARDATDDQSRAAIAALDAARSNNEDLKRAGRVEFCRWFLPLIASFPDKATLAELVAHHFLDDLTSEFQPSESYLQQLQQCIWAMTTLLEGHPRPFDKEATVRLNSELYARWFEQMSQPWLRRGRDLFGPLRKELVAWPTEVRWEAWSSVLADVAPRKPSENKLRRAGNALRAVDNVFGKSFVLETTSITYIPTEELNQARMDAARIRIALRLYEKHHGRLPSQLGELVQDGELPEVPRDPYDGEPFRYSPERRVLWCVGHEGTNKGELSKTESSEGPFASVEPTWPIDPLNPEPPEN